MKYFTAWCLLHNSRQEVALTKMKANGMVSQRPSEVTKTSRYQHNLSVVLLTDDHYGTAHVARMKH